MTGKGKAVVSSRKRRISKREAYLILIFLFLLIATAMWHFSGALYYAEIKDLLEQRAELEQETALLNSILEQKDQINADWLIWQGDRDRLNRAIPEREDLAAVLGKLDAHLNLFEGTVNKFNIGETTDHLQYSTISLYLSVSGSKDQVQLLLQNLETFPHLLIIDSIAWAATADELVKLDLLFRLIFMNINEAHEILD